MPNPYITPELFAFLRELKANNDRDWFALNKKRYEKHVKEPLLDLIADFSPLLADISPHFLAIPKASGGSFFRIHRDVRFSDNKDPYKTHAAIQFRHSSAKDVHAPGYYLHIEPGNVFVGLGIWQPENPVLNQIRSAILEDGGRWQKVRDAAVSSGLELKGDSLKRPPLGVDANHDLVIDLKRKDFMAVAEFEQDVALRPDFLPLLAETWKAGSPFMQFISNAIKVSF
ncbi:MAG: TIGR02453 family protein [Bacteroidetes bacterium]|nr:TIGR02453 family protein [Bacteroidota bacterium]